MQQKQKYPTDPPIVSKSASHESSWIKFLVTGLWQEIDKESSTWGCLSVPFTAGTKKEVLIYISFCTEEDLFWLVLESSLANLQSTFINYGSDYKNNSQQVLY